MSFLWGGAAKPEAPKETPRDKARKFLTTTYGKHRPDKVCDIETILDVYQGKEDELISQVTMKYLTPHALKVSEVRGKLIAHYTAHNPSKVPAVDEMLERFKGKEDELLAEVLRKHGSAGSVLSAVATAPMNNVPNTSLPVHLQDKRLFYSGYLWQHVPGWLTSRQKRWCMLIGQHFYLGTDPTDTTFETLSLTNSDVTDKEKIDDAFAFCLVHPTAGNLVFYTDNEVEKLVWCVQLEVATLQANPTRSADTESRSLYQRVFSEYPQRLCVPYYKELAEVVPEKLSQPVVTGYIVCKTGDSWLGENWARRYVTLHDCFLTVRDDKSSPAGLRIYPLRDGELEEHDIGTEEAPDMTFSFYSDFVPLFALRPDNAEQYKQWYTALSEAFLRANPDQPAPEAENDKDLKDAAPAQKTLI